MAMSRSRRAPTSRVPSAVFADGLNGISTSDVFIPQLRVFLNEAVHQRDAVGIVQEDDVDAVLAEKRGVPREVAVFANDHPLDAKLHDGARAHHARTERRV